MKPDGTGRSCYKLESGELGWDDAQEACQNSGGTLANIKTALEWNHILSV